MTRITTLSPEIARELIDFYRAAKAAGLLSIPRQSASSQFVPETPIFVKNVSGGTVPAFACMQAVGTVEYGGQNYITVAQPVDITGAAGGYLFNSSWEVANNGYGVAYAGPLVRSKATVAAGRCSPTVGGWVVVADVNGMFTAVGDDDIATDVSKIFCHGGPTVVQTFITQLRVDGTELQAKTRDVYMYAAGDETDWAPWHIGAECDGA